MLAKIALLSGIQAVAYTVVQLLIKLVTTPLGTQLPLDKVRYLFDNFLMLHSID